MYAQALPHSSCYLPLPGPYLLGKDVHKADSKIWNQVVSLPSKHTQAKEDLPRLVTFPGWLKYSHRSALRKKIFTPTLDKIPRTQQGSHKSKDFTMNCNECTCAHRQSLLDFWELPWNRASHCGPDCGLVDSSKGQVPHSIANDRLEMALTTNQH